MGGVQGVTPSFEVGQVLVGLGHYQKIKPPGFIRAWIRANSLEGMAICSKTLGHGYKVILFI